MYMYIYVYIYIYVCICICVCIYIYICRVSCYTARRDAALYDIVSWS